MKCSSSPSSASALASHSSPSNSATASPWAHFSSAPSWPKHARPAASKPSSPPSAVYVSVITTLLTPYRIRSSDPISNWLERKGPKNIQDYLHLYTSWLQGLRGGDGANARIRRLLRKWAMQLGLNLALVSGFMIVASSIGAHAETWLPPMKWLPPQTG